MEAGRKDLAARDRVRPVRREVEAFRFSTVRLDVRENTTKLNAALRALARSTAGAPSSGRRRRVACLARGGAGRPLHRAAGARAPVRVGGDARHVPAGAAAARRDRPGGVRQLRAEHDAERGRRARRLPAGQDGRTVRRHCGRRELHPSHRPAVRDDRGPAARAGHHEGAAHRSAGAPERSGAGRGAGSDDRLLRLQQGRRVPHLELGALQGPDQAHPDRAAKPACRSRSSTAAAVR